MKFLNLESIKKDTPLQEGNLKLSDTPITLQDCIIFVQKQKKIYISILERLGGNFDGAAEILASAEQYYSIEKFLQELLRKNAPTNS